MDVIQSLIASDSLWLSNAAGAVLDAPNGLTASNLLSSKDPNISKDNLAVFGNLTDAKRPPSGPIINPLLDGSKPAPSITPTPTNGVSPTPSPSPSSIGSTVSNVPGQDYTKTSFDIATQLVQDRFVVMYNFDGNIYTYEGGDRERRRAVGFGGDKNTFSWFRWLTLEDAGYNPYAGGAGPGGSSETPWSLKKWYQFGCRSFHLHCPFGKPSADKNRPEYPGSEELVYQIDQFLCAKDGLTVLGGNASNPEDQVNTAMPWLVNDFVDVWKALITGQKGRLGNREWAEILTWFNPADPIRVIAYVGGMADAGAFGHDAAYSNYTKRWQRLFNTNPTAANQRLRNSVQPFLDCKMSLGFDALSASPGPQFGEWVPYSRMSKAMQVGWWNFIDGYVKRAVKAYGGKVYTEAYPFIKEGMANPYLGYDIISDRNWWQTKCFQSGASRPHESSDMGAVELLLANWSGTPETQPLVSTQRQDGTLIPESFFYLNNISPIEFAVIQAPCEGGAKEKRLVVPNCCGGFEGRPHNYYHNHILPAMLANHYLEPQYNRVEQNPARYALKASLMVPFNALQVLPTAYSGDPRAALQFGARFATITDFTKYIANLIDDKVAAQATSYAIYDPSTLGL